MTTSLFDLTDRVAVVSGGAQGMGRSMATAFAGAGADVVLADINLEGAEKTAASLRELGRRAIAVECHVSSPEAIDGLFATVDKEFGQVDILGNVAGEGVMCDPLELKLSDLERVLWSLAIGRFYMCQQAAKRMIPQGRGSIMSLGSIASERALGRGHLAYSMGMGAVVTMTRELSTEWSAKGVRVNAILPAQTINPGLEKRYAENPNVRKRHLTGLPVGRFGKSDDIQTVALFLASDASSFITGVTLPMDGGNLAMTAGGSPMSWGDTDTVNGIDKW